MHTATRVCSAGHGGQILLAASGWVALVAALGWLDDQTGPTYAFDFLYLLPVLAAA